MAVRSHSKAEALPLPFNGGRSFPLLLFYYTVDANKFKQQILDWEHLEDAFTKS